MFEVNKEAGTIRMYGDIGWYFEDGIGAEDVIKALDEMGGQDFTLTLKSDGGDVFEGLSISNNLSNYDGNVTIVVDAIAASIASVIAVSAQKTTMFPNSMLMIHNPWTVAVGDAKEFRGVADTLDLIGGEIAAIYSRKSGEDAQTYLDMMDSDTYLTAQQSLELGLIDGIVGQSEDTEQTAPIAAVAAFSNRIDKKNRLAESRLNPKTDEQILHKAKIS